MTLKLWHFGRKIRNAWKVLNCGIGGGFRKFVGSIVLETKKYCIESRRRGLF
jgi:hypothetical protein